MCFRGKKSKFCLICLLLSTWLPESKEHVQHGTEAYSELHDHPDTDIADIDPAVHQLTEPNPAWDKDYFINELAQRYGDGDTISFEGLEHLLQRLGLGKVVIADHDLECHKENADSDFRSFHSHHNHTTNSTSVANPCVSSKDNHVEHDHLNDVPKVHDHLNVDPKVHDHSNEHNDELNHLNKDNNENIDPGKIKEHNEVENLHEHSHEEIDEHIDHDNIHKHNVSEHLGGKIDHSNETNDKHIDKDNLKEYNVSDDEHLDSEHKHNDDDTDSVAHKHEHSKHLDTINATVKEENHTVDDGHEHEGTEKRSVPQENKCLPADVMLNLEAGSQFSSVSKDVFKDICPILIYQIDTDSCHQHHTHSEHLGDHDDNHDDHQLHDHGDVDAVSASDISNIPAKVWGYSIIAVVIISLVGLLGVAVIPIMQKVFYNHMLQFLVALAVGALSGDAMLHLLPHAIAGGHSESSSGGHETSHDHMGPVLKGLCGLTGIYLFFLIERIVTIFTEIKRQKKKSKNNRKYLKNIDEDKIGEKLASSTHETECDEILMSIHPNKDGDDEIIVGSKQALQGYADEAHNEHCTISFENTTTISHEHGHHHHNNHNNSSVGTPDADEAADMLSHGNKGHGHSHCHDGVPNSVSAIAWMVILGDGIHNFSDGLAIGAAFANSITGGFSTSVAVFCHELPHEIGDFAMLLRAGMSPKQAIIYNCLSSVLSFIGMLIGVAIGNIENASLWIFAVVGGMFLYIALVDMLPELSSVDTKKGENRFCHLLLQIVGMMVGGGIMLMIALYEEQLKTLLD